MKPTNASSTTRECERITPRVVGLPELPAEDKLGTPRALNEPQGCPRIWAASRVIDATPVRRFFQEDLGWLGTLCPRQRAVGSSFGARRLDRRDL